MTILCRIFGHRRRVVFTMPGFFVGDPDLFDCCECTRCGKQWREEPPRKRRVKAS